MHASINFFSFFFVFNVVSKTKFTSLDSINHSKVNSECSPSIAKSTNQMSPHSAEKCVRKWSQQLFLWPQLSQGHWKWSKMVEVNGVYKYGWYERIWLKILCTISPLPLPPPDSHVKVPLKVHPSSSSFGLCTWPAQHQDEQFSCRWIPLDCQSDKTAHSIISVTSVCCVSAQNIISVNTTV